MNKGKTANLETPAPDADQPEAQDDMGRTVTQRKSEVRLGREVQARIGQQLRAMYDDVVKEGVPQHIADLVRRLSDHDDGVA
jgi:aromatic ring-cleaving dioxygenase